MTVTIPKPCDQNWRTFAPTKHGGFCSSCSKEVIDFTTWQPEEIRRYFLARPQGACGKFRASQLGEYPSSDGLKITSAMKWIAPSLVSASLSLASTDAIAQPSHNIEFNIHKSAGGESNRSAQTPNSTSVREITGTVVDPEGQPIPGVNVYLKGMTTGDVTDVDGKYKLVILRPTPSDVLSFSFIGMITQEIFADDKETINVTLNYDLAMLSEVIVVGGACAYRWYSPRGWWYKISGLFRRRW
jgi:hypothetical protein